MYRASRVLCSPHVITAFVSTSRAVGLALKIIPKVSFIVFGKILVHVFVSVWIELAQCEGAVSKHLQRKGFSWDGLGECLGTVTPAWLPAGDGTHGPGHNRS